MRMLVRVCLLCCVALSIGCRLQAGSAASSMGQNAATIDAATKPRTPLIGTWISSQRNGGEWHKLNDELISTEPRRADGPLRHPPMIIYDGLGHWANTNMPVSLQQSKANDQLTPDEAKEVLAGVSTAFGTFVFSATHQLVFNHPHSYINTTAPFTAQGDTGIDRIKLLGFPPGQMIWKPLPLTRSDRISWGYWDKVPPLAQLTPAHRRLIGFWKVLSQERRKANGETLSSTPVEGGYIVYASSGYMQFHLLQPNRDKWATKRVQQFVREHPDEYYRIRDLTVSGVLEPTPAEAKMTLETYTAYVARYSIDERTRVVTHQGVGAISGQKGPDAHHSYEIAGNRLILTAPPTMVAGQEVRTVVTGERISGDDPALQP